MLCHADLNQVCIFQSELTKFEETLIDSKRYKELLFKLSPPEWQEAQKLKALKAKGLSPKEEESSIEESSIRNGMYLVFFKGPILW